MNPRIRKTRTLFLLVCLTIPAQHGVIAQQAANLRFANEWCYPRVDDDGTAAFPRTSGISKTAPIATAARRAINTSPVHLLGLAERHRQPDENLEPAGAGCGATAAGHVPRRSRRCKHDHSEVVERERDDRGPHRESRQCGRRGGQWHVGGRFHCNLHDEWLRTLHGEPGRYTAQDVEPQLHGDERDPFHFRVQPGQ
jgi:hypothetical protein